MRYIRQLFKWLFRLSRSAAASVEAINIVQKPQEAESIQSKDVEVQDIPFFSRKNNLAEEFAYEPTPVYSANLSSDEITGYLQADGRITPYKYFKGDNASLKIDKREFLKEIYKGYVLVGYDAETINQKKAAIDDGQTASFFTEEEYALVWGKNATEEELLADDVDFLKGKVVPQKEEEPKTVGYSAGIDPYKK